MGQRGVPDPLLIALGQAVRQRRTALGLSQEELAHRAGLHRTYIGSLERGERNVAFLNLIRLADALECPLEALLAHIGQPADVDGLRNGGAP